MQSLHLPGHSIHFPEVKPWSLEYCCLCPRCLPLPCPRCLPLPWPLHRRDPSLPLSMSCFSLLCLLDSLLFAFQDKRFYLWWGEAHLLFAICDSCFVYIWVVLF